MYVKRISAAVGLSQQQRLWLTCRPSRRYQILFLFTILLCRNRNRNYTHAYTNDGPTIENNRKNIYYLPTYKRSRADIAEGQPVVTRRCRHRIASSPYCAVNARCTYDIIIYCSLTCARRRPACSGDCRTREVLTRFNHWKLWYYIVFLDRGTIRPIRFAHKPRSIPYVLNTRVVTKCR